jgi:DDE_Tnp_1-associated
MLLLQSFISHLKDPRKKQGGRHTFENLMTMILIGHCLNYTGYRGVHRFATNNTEFLMSELDMPYGIPCHNTFRRLLLRLQAADVIAAFNAWSAAHFPIATNSNLSIDGQALGSTVTNSSNEEQNFAAVVTLFSQNAGISHALQMYESKKTSEIYVVAELLGAVLPKNAGILQQADALHSKKNDRNDC